MAWEQRGSHSYYYRKERSGPRVFSVYVGRGDIAELSSALDEMEQVQKETKSSKERRERETFKSLDASIDSLVPLTSTLTQAVLIASGFHQHKRQMEEAQDMSTIALASGSEKAVSQDADKIRERFRSLLTKANKEHPREPDVKALRELLNGNKDLKLWKDVMGMGELAENQALDTITEDRDSGHGSRECWKQRLVSMRAELGHETSTPLERLLIQQVTLCWLNLSLLEYRHVNIMKQSITLTLGAYWDKRLSMAQRRFTRAAESLARVRRLSRRIPLQVNIAAHGGQQVNVAREG